MAWKIKEKRKKSEKVQSVFKKALRNLITPEILIYLQNNLLYRFVEMQIAAAVKSVGVLLVYANDE